MQQNLPRDSADGGHQSGACHIRIAKMWVEVISNESSLICGTNAFSALHERSLSIHGAVELSQSLFLPLVFKRSCFLFLFFEHEFLQFKLPLNDKLRVPHWKRSHVFEASRPLHLFDQKLGCGLCRSESGSEAPWGTPFMPATSGG